MVSAGICLGVQARGDPQALGTCGGLWVVTVRVRVAAALCGNPAPQWLCMSTPGSPDSVTGLWDCGGV